MLSQTISLQSVHKGAKYGQVPNTWNHIWCRRELEMLWSSHCLAQANLPFRSWGFPLNTYLQENEKQPFPFHLPHRFLFLGRSKLWLFPSCSYLTWPLTVSSNFQFLKFSILCIFYKFSDCFCLECPEAPCIIQSTSQLQTFRLPTSTHWKSRNFISRLKCDIPPWLKCKDFAKYENAIEKKKKSGWAPSPPAVSPGNPRHVAGATRTSFRETFIPSCLLREMC